MSDRQQVGSQREEWTFGYLLDVVLTRDPWMHRVDIARATHRPMVLTSDHDGVLVADVVAEWAERHGERFAMELAGPAGGSWFGSGRAVCGGCPRLLSRAVGSRCLAGMRSLEVPF